MEKSRVLFLVAPYLLLIRRQGGIKMTSASTPSVNEPNGLILVHTEKLKPKDPISGKLASSGVSHRAFASVLL